MGKLLIRSGVLIGGLLLASGAQAEVGYGNGALAVAALQSGDFRTAERILHPVSLADAQDPARLINIASVYARSGRAAEARAALLRAAEAPEMPLVLASGREASSRTIARLALAQVAVEVASR